MEILQSTKIYQLLEKIAPKDFRLISIHENETVAQALKLMKAHGIISLPIRTSNNSFVGFIDMLDLVAFISTKFAQVSLLATESFRQMEEFGQKSIKEIQNISGRNEIVTVSHLSPIIGLCKNLSKPNTHRVVVLNEVLAFLFSLITI